MRFQLLQVHKMCVATQDLLKNVGFQKTTGQRIAIDTDAE
jgi:hypothetical protein